MQADGRHGDRLFDAGEAVFGLFITQRIDMIERCLSFLKLYGLKFYRREAAQ